MATITVVGSFAGAEARGQSHRMTGGRRAAHSACRCGASRAALSRFERLTLIALALILAACALASRRPVPDGLTTVRVRVEQGDTLWAIAQNNTPVGLSTEQAADLIAKLNGLGSYDLVAGTELDVPVSSVSQNERLASK